MVIESPGAPLKRYRRAKCPARRGAVQLLVSSESLSWASGSIAVVAHGWIENSMGRAVGLFAAPSAHTVTVSRYTPVPRMAGSSVIDVVPGAVPLIGLTTTQA